jgi:hypothetical protein
MIFLIQRAERLQFLAHSLIDGPARSVVGRYDDRVFRAGRIIFCYRFDALLRVYDLRHAALLLKHLHTNSGFIF